MTDLLLKLCRRTCAEKNLTGQTWDSMFRKSCWQEWPTAALWELGFLEGSRQSVIRMAHVPEPFVKTMQFTLNICSLPPTPAGESGTLVHACRQKVVTWPAPIKTGRQASNKLPGGALGWEESRACCVTPPGAWAWPPRTWCLCLSFAAMKRSEERGSPPSRGAGGHLETQACRARRQPRYQGATNILKHVAHFLKKS